MTMLEKQQRVSDVVITSSQITNTKSARHRLKPKAQASLLGDHSVCDPPDPIPNSAVKPVCADGTVAQAPEE